MQLKRKSKLPSVIGLTTSLAVRCHNYPKIVQQLIHTPKAHKTRAQKTPGTKKTQVRKGARIRSITPDPEYHKSDMVLRHQTTIMAIKFSKILARVMIRIAFFKKFLCKQFIASVEVSSMARCFSKSDELRNTKSIGRRASISPSKNMKLTFSKPKSPHSPQNLTETISLEMDICKSNTRAWHQRHLLCLAGALKGIFDKINIMFKIASRYSAQSANNISRLSSERESTTPTPPPLITKTNPQSGEHN